MNTFTKLCSENVYPFFCCPIKHQTFFKYFTLIFLFIDSITFFTSFASSILSFQFMSFFTILFKAALILGLLKIYSDFNSTGNYDTKFAYIYSFIRLVFIALSLSFLLMRSVIQGAFSALFFPLRHHSKHFIANEILALIIFLGMIFYCLYLNVLYFLVIKLSKNKILKTGEKNLDKAESNKTEPQISISN